ncbi:MAG: hypothetical protein ABIJ31_04655 [Pseudomonadota bacterium]
MNRLLTKSFKFLPILVFAGLTLVPSPAQAIQLHLSSEGIITHQMGHLFFLVSMGVLIFTVSGKGLNKHKGWRLIQYSAFFFILWNLDALFGHFLDNQIKVVKIENISFSRMRMLVHEDSQILYWVYYALKLDHLLAVPAMLLFFMGLSALVNEQQAMAADKENH